MLERLSNAAVDQQRTLAAGVGTDAIAAEQAQKDAARFTSRLGERCWKEFQAARDNRREVTDLMLQDLRALRCEYDPEDLAIIKAEGGSQIYLPLIANKVRLAVALMYAIYMESSRPFNGRPSTIPEIPPDIMAAIQQQAMAKAQMAGAIAPTGLIDQEVVFNLIDGIKADVIRRAKDWAQARADYNADQVNDVLQEGGFYEVLPDFFHDFCAMRGGFIKGPTVRMVRDIDWSPQGGAQVNRKPKRVYTAPSCFDMFPGPGAVTVNDSTLSERIKVTRAELYEMRDAPGFNPAVVDQVLVEFDNGHKLTNWYWEDTERARLETLTNDAMFRVNHGTIDLIEHWTHCSGQELLDFGMDPAMVDDPLKPYSVVAWLCGTDRVLGVRINDDPLQRRPYFKGGFSAVRGSFWYEGVCSIGRQYARMANATARAMSNNIGMAAGFITELQVDRLARGEQPRKPIPYDLFQTNQARNGASGPAMFFHQPNLNSQHYQAIIDQYSAMLDEALGLPGFLSGINEESGAGGTSSGLAQLRQMQSTAFGYATMSVDQCINGVCEATHRDLLLTPDGPQVNATDPSNPRQIVGDVFFEARGARSAAERQATQVRLNELLNATNNNTDMAIIGIPGRAELLREAFSGFEGVNVDRVVPSRDLLIMQQAQQQLQATMGEEGAGGPPQPPGPAGVDPAGQPMGAEQGPM